MAKRRSRTRKPKQRKNVKPMPKKSNAKGVTFEDRMEVIKQDLQEAERHIQGRIQQLMREDPLLIEKTADRNNFQRTIALFDGDLDDNIMLMQKQRARQGGAPPPPAPEPDPPEDDEDDIEDEVDDIEDVVEPEPPEPEPETNDDAGEPDLPAQTGD